MRIFAAILFILSLSPAYAVDVGVYWTAESGATGYYVYYSEDSGATWSAGTDAGVATNYTMTGMDEDKVVSVLRQCPLLQLDKLCGVPNRSLV